MRPRGPRCRLRRRRGLRCGARCISPAIRASRPSRRALKDTLPATYHVYEASRLLGVKRVVYAQLDPRGGLPRCRQRARYRGAPPARHVRPGLTKTFTEDLASLYWDKFGLESVCLRICSCFPEPADRRMFWSWLSFADCVRLTEAALTAPRVGFSVVYGTSDNAQKGVSNDRASHRSASGRRTAPTVSPKRCGRGPSGPIRRGRVEGGGGRFRGDGPSG